MNSTPGKKKLIRDISANTLQTVVTQVFGLIIFYITSKYLQKDDFGQLNWCMAVGSTIIAVSSLGLDLVFVKRIALGQNVLILSGIHFFHTLVVGLVLCGVAFLVKQFLPSFTSVHPFFFYVFLNLALANVANSFKLCLNGLEAYRQLAFMSFCINTFKLVAIISLYLFARFDIMNVILAYTLTSLFEFILGYYMMSRSLSRRVKPLLKIMEYKYFILESLPQLGVVVFDSALARIDWILLGIISTASATAEYSFAYKIFELSKLPLLIIAPVVLTRFSKLFSGDNVISDKHKDEIGTFFKLEMFVIMFIPIVLAVTWTPLIDYFTNNKYGAVNELNYRILALCVPLHGVINFLWTMGFVQGQLKKILFITVTVSGLNILANAIFIPVYGALGSSLAFLTCTLIQLLLYLKYIDQKQVKLNYVNVILSLLSAFLSVLISKFLLDNVIYAAILAVILHSCIIFGSGQIKLFKLKQILSKS